MLATLEGHLVWFGGKDSLLQSPRRNYIGTLRVQLPKYEVYTLHHTYDS